jgi:transcriptional regulator with GAF, ATPase, and Fis domain
MLFVVGIFLDWKESIYALLFTLATMAVFGWLFSNGFITNYDDVVSTDPLSWSNLTFELLGMGVFIVVSLNYLVPQIREALTRSRMLTQELEQIQANLEKQVAERTRSAEQARLEAEKTRQSLEQQLEFVSAQAQLNDILRSEQEIDDLADNVLSYLCRYLDAPVGILYLLENGALRRAGQFALPVDFAQDVQIKPGEGLVGQSALEKRTIIMRGVSSESLKINSGLGQAPPATILIVPLIYSDEVVGVLELGLLDNDIAGKTMFLEKVDESVAIAFNAINDRLRIEHLLAETQRQAERLRSQEEELRTTNEELRAQADIRYSGRDA